MSKIIGSLKRTLWKTSTLRQTVLEHPAKTDQTRMPERAERVEKTEVSVSSEENLVKEVASSNFANIKERQAFFQREDGQMPSYLKAGMRDKHLFNFTLLFVGIGIAMSIETVLKLVVNDEHLL